MVDLSTRQYVLYEVGMESMSHVHVHLLLPTHLINMIHFFFYHIQDKHNIICKVKTTDSNTRHIFTQNRRLNKLYCQ